MKYALAKKTERSSSTRRSEVLGATIAILLFAGITTLFAADGTSHPATFGGYSSLKTNSNDLTGNDSSSHICQAVLRRPLNQLWMHSVLPQLYSDMFDVSSPLERNTTIRDYYTNALVHGLSYQDWYKTIGSSNSGDSKTSARILKLLERVGSNHKHDDPIRILVYGGSVAEGSQCTKSYKFPELIESMGNGFKACGWPWILQRLADNWLGVGVVQVDSLAIGGAFTSTSVGLMEMKLTPRNYPEGTVPDIVIWNHGVNDQFLESPDKVAAGLYEFQLAARRMAPHALIIYLNDVYGQCAQPARSMKWVGAPLSEVTTWFEESSLLVSVNRLFVHHWVSTKAKPAFGGSALADLLPGSKINCHGGVFAHMTMAASILFNLLSATVSKCLNEDFQEFGKDSANNFHSKLPVEFVPSTFSETADGPLRLHSWQEIQQSWEKTTEKQQISENKRPSCLTKLALMNKSEQEVNRQVESILVSNNGWRPRPSGSYDKQGWGAYQPNVSFVAQFPVTPQSKYLKLITLQSYNGGWVNATLEIRLTRVYQEEETTVGGSIASSATTTHYVSGYNVQSNTTPAVFFKFPLPLHDERFANVSLKMACRMVSGSMFKIMALSVCDE